MTSLPLARFRVLDLMRVRAGHTAVRQLVDWGANVIKVEAPASSAEGSPRAATSYLLRRAGE